MAVLLVIGLCRAWSWFNNKKEFFDELGRQLDDKFIIPSVDEDRNDDTKEYKMTNFGDKNVRKPSYSRADSKDSMEVYIKQSHQDVLYHPFFSRHFSTMKNENLEGRTRPPGARAARAASWGTTG